MEDQFYTAFVDSSIADLVPEYMQNRRKEVELLKRYLEEGDFDKIAGLAHRMVGVGTPYGFHHISSLAKVIHETARASDRDTVSSLIAEYAHYVKHVTIKYRS
jgi:hypothetical protein